MAEVCGRQHWLQSGWIKAQWGREEQTSLEHQARETFFQVEMLSLKTSCILCNFASLFPHSPQTPGPQRRRSLGLLRLRDRRAPPAPGEGRLDLWLLSLLFSPSLSRTRSRSRSRSPCLGAPLLTTVLQSFSRPFSLSFFSSSRFLSSSSSCSLRLRSRSFCRSVRSKSLWAAWRAQKKIKSSR